MSTHQQLTAIDNEYGASHGSTESYVAGFLLSILLTLAAYALVVVRVLSEREAVAVIIILAVLQLVVQLVFFLHLSRKSRARWNLTALMFTLLFVTILVIGSLWIMDNLNDNMITSFVKNTSVLSAY